METFIEPKEIPIPQAIRDKWQSIVSILVRVLKIPSALVMKVDYPSFTVFQAGDSQENPFQAGAVFTLPAGIYCEKTMSIKNKLLIPNALKDPEWDHNPSIAAGIISYLGFPIFYPNKEVFGTLCVLDKKENSYSTDAEDILLQFKEIIESHLVLLWQNATLEDLLKQQKSFERQLKEKYETIERIDKISVDRESRIVELQKTVAKLEEDLKKVRRDSE